MRQTFSVVAAVIRNENEKIIEDKTARLNSTDMSYGEAWASLLIVNLALSLVINHLIAINQSNLTSDWHIAPMIRNITQTLSSIPHWEARLAYKQIQELKERPSGVGLS